MQPHDYPAIETYVSRARIRSYTALTTNGSLEQCIGAYIWNKRVGAALFPLLQCLEVTIRNAVHNSAASYFNTPDWFDPLTKLAGHDYFQSFIAQHTAKGADFYRIGVSKGSRKGKKIWTSRHENMLLQAKKKLRDAGKPLDANAIVAELMFGFWVGMFEKNYHDLNFNNRLWPHLEPIVFPNLLPSQRRHNSIHNILHPIKELRNRMAHHEPIWKHPSVSNVSAAIQMLKETIDNSVMLIAGISSERAALIHESGIEGMVRAICSKEVLDFYLSGRVSKAVSARRLKRDMIRHIDGKHLFPSSYNHAGKETVFLNLNIINII
ncbi:Abi family protein [Yersinia enterocolitica]|uniref:Abi family protein n=1 Tax=Yersinia enterocolitica TaxID=630 RepID=UPI003D79045B